MACADEVDTFAEAGRQNEDRKATMQQRTLPFDNTPIIARVSPLCFWGGGVYDTKQLHNRRTGRALPAR